MKKGDLGGFLTRRTKWTPGKTNSISATTWKSSGQHIPVASVDLIYLDPPFNSNATYNVLFAEKTGEQSAAQITAFDDTWHWGPEADGASDEVVTAGTPKLADLLQALAPSWAATT